MQWSRLFRSVKARLGWFFTIIAVIKWLADWWGVRAAVRDWAGYFPSVLKFAEEPWITPTVLALGLALIVWAALGRGGSVGFDNIRWLPARYQKTRLPHEYLVGIPLAVVLVIFAFVMHRMQGKGFMQLGYARFVNKRLAPGERLSVNIWIKNNGGQAVDDTYVLFGVVLGPVVSEGTDRDTHASLHSRALESYVKMRNEGQPGITVGKGEGVWDTLVVPKPPEAALTQDRIDDILRGSQRLYVFAWARWKDAPHDLDFCEWLQPPLTNEINNANLIWHLCAD
jgi:hypothetical protein